MAKGEQVEMGKRQRSCFHLNAAVEKKQRIPEAEQKQWSVKNKWQWSEAIN